MDKSQIISMDELYKSMLKCQQGVMWKPSVSSFSLNWLTQLMKLERELTEGTYKGREPKPVIVTYPKRRECLCIPFRDRVYQRSLNDNALYPMVTKSFIYDNAACQKNKGTDFAIRRLKKFLWNFYCNYGSDGYVLHIDIHHYYQEMRHETAKNEFSKHVPPDIMKMAATVLDSQYAGDVGYNPGSQMVQIAGISVPSPLDHYCKEKLHIKYYLRYMDDFILIHHSKKLLYAWLDAIKTELAKMGFSVSIGKTKILPLRKGFLFLGFRFRLTATGKVLTFINGQNVKHEKRKLKRMVRLVRQGTLTKRKVDVCFYGWMDSHLAKGTTNQIKNRMQKYYKALWANGGSESNDLHTC